MADDDEKAKKEVSIEKEEEEEKEKWVKHYSSNHQILLVGEGDFSFSLSLALSFGSASNIVATSFDSYDSVIKKYEKAKLHLENLVKLGASTLHGVDATNMKLHSDLKMRKFDRIVFNFPHAGFHGKEDNPDMIGMHRGLVGGFFRNANGMSRANGEIHVNHKTSAPFCRWNIEELAQTSSLSLTACVEFKIEDYPGYNNKRGDGIRCDDPFPLGECSTFKFRLSRAAKNRSRAGKKLVINCRRTLKIQGQPIQVQYPASSFDHGHPETGFAMDRNDFSVCRQFPISTIRGSANASIGYFNHAMEALGGAVSHVGYSLQEAPRSNYERYLVEIPGRIDGRAIGHVNYSLHEMSKSNFERCTAEALGRTSDVQHSRSISHLDHPLHEAFQSGLDRYAAEAPGRTWDVQYSRSISHLDYSLHEASRGGFERYMAGAPGRALEVPGRSISHVDYQHNAARSDFDRYMVEGSGRILHGNLYPLREHQSFSNLISASRVRRMLLAYGKHPEGARGMAS